MTSLLYIIGAPGSGKTSLVTSLVAPLIGVEVEHTLAHTAYYAEDGTEVCAVLGRSKAPFGGTDTLSWTCAPRVLALLESGTYEAVVAEGDRLADSKFLASCRDAGVTVHVAYLDTPEDTAEARRRRRSTAHGLKLQNPSWVRGRTSKHSRLAVAEGAQRLDGSLPVPGIVRSMSDPVSVRIRSHYPPEAQ